MTDDAWTLGNGRGHETPREVSASWAGPREGQVSALYENCHGTGWTLHYYVEKKTRKGKKIKNIMLNNQQTIFPTLTFVVTAHTMGKKYLKKKK